MESLAFMSARHHAALSAVWHMQPSTDGDSDAAVELAGLAQLVVVSFGSEGDAMTSKQI